VPEAPIIEEPDQDDLQPIVIGGRRVEDTNLDITPMIDIVFLLIIFFLVASTPDAETAVDLPQARYGGGVAKRESAIITIARTDVPGRADVYLGEGKNPDTLVSRDIQIQNERLIAYLQEALTAEGRSKVLIMAEKGVLHRDVARVAAAAGVVAGESLYLAVFETE
jgi:biopolymer transport protein ExbD